MTGLIEARLAEKNIHLPEAAAPAANYVPWVVTGNLVFVSGQITMEGGEITYQGRVGRRRGSARSTWSRSSGRPAGAISTGSVG